jgi:hypothetical protein
LDKKYKTEVKSAKADFYKKMVADLKLKKPGQWYSAVKRMTSYENKSQQLIVNEISHLSDQDQCDLIASEFAKVPNQYNPLHKDDIHIPQFSEQDIPQFQEAQVWKKLAALKVKKSSREGDVPAQIVRLFAAYLAEPLTNIVNCAIRTGEYPNIWKQEMATPKNSPNL